jgi:hypothetical protein
MRAEARSIRQRGQALIVALLTLLVLTLLGLALTSMSMVSMTVSINEREASEALYVADSGIAHATAILATQSWPNFDPALRSGDAQGCTGDELQAAPPGAVGFPPTAELIPAAGRAFPPAGSYQVRVCDDHALEQATNRPPALPDADPNHDANERVLIRSTGIGRNGATATIEAMLARVELPGILVDGNLRINGNVSVMGAGGSVHANGELDLVGNPCAQQYFSASGGVSGAGSAQGGAGCTGAGADVRSAQDSIPVPVIAPASLRPRADYLLGADGLIRNQAGAVVTLASWSWDAGSRRWSGGGNIPAGTYYAAGNIDISGNPGRGGPGPSPLPLTLIAEGWIDVTGTPNLVPALAGTPSYSFVAGTDVRLAGNPGTTYSGLIYAGDQIDFTGNPNVNGQVIAKNNGDLGYPPNPASPGQNNLVRLQGGYMVISGDVRVTYDGGGGLSSVSLTGWRECRGPDPDNPCGIP